MHPSEHKQERDSTDSKIIPVTEEQNWIDTLLDFDEI